MASIPGGKSASAETRQSRKPTTESRKGRAESRKPTAAPGRESRQSEPSSPQASKPSGLEIHGSSCLDAAAVEDIIADLRGIEHVLGTASPLVEQARQIAFTMICDDPAKRDALARLGQRLSGGTGGDIDRFGPHNLRLMDDDLLEGIIQAADSVIDAALWRLDRLRCVLVRASQSRNQSVGQKADSGT